MAPCGRNNRGGGGRATKSPQIDPGLPTTYTFLCRTLKPRSKVLAKSCLNRPASNGPYLQRQSISDKSFPVSEELSCGRRSNQFSICSPQGSRSTHRRASGSNQTPASYQPLASNQPQPSPPPRASVSHHSSQAQNSHKKEDEEAILRKVC